MVDSADEREEGRKRKEGKTQHLIKWHYHDYVKNSLTKSRAKTTQLGLFRSFELFVCLTFILPLIALWDSGVLRRRRYLILNRQLVPHSSHNQIL